MISSTKIKWFVIQSNPYRFEPGSIPEDLLEKPQVIALMDRLAQGVGWGNGYVCLPPGHPCYGISCWDIETRFNIEVNGGLTFGNYASNLSPNVWAKHLPPGAELDYVVGFDTAHAWNSREEWPKLRVETEPAMLARQFELIMADPEYFNKRKGGDSEGFFE